MHARELGVATVFQEFSLVPTLTVAENIHLGRWPGSRAWLDWRRMRDEAHRAFAAMEIEIDPDAIVGELPIAAAAARRDRQGDRARGLDDHPRRAHGGARARRDRPRLHALLRRLRAQGQSVLYVSHRLDEVTALVDVATVLRNGRVVSPAETTRIEIGAIVASMVGGEVGSTIRRSATPPPSSCLRSRGSPTANGVRKATFTVHRGEVLGLGGVLGSGRTAIARALFGLDQLTAGEIRLADRELPARGPKDMIRAGFALLTEDRKADGLFVNFDTPRNITIANLASIVRGGRLDLAASPGSAMPMLRSCRSRPRPSASRSTSSRGATSRR